MDSPTAVVSALVAALAALDAQQKALVAKLEGIHAQLGQSGQQDEELLPTLTLYINKASYIQRRMMLIHSRVGDLKRRSDRLREHWAKHSRQVAGWIEQERSRHVPTAATLHLPANSHAAPRVSSMPPSPVQPSLGKRGEWSRPGTLLRASEATADRSLDADDAPGIATLDLVAGLPEMKLGSAKEAEAEAEAEAVSAGGRLAEQAPPATAHEQWPQSPPTGAGFRTPLPASASNPSSETTTPRALAQPGSPHPGGTSPGTAAKAPEITQIASIKRKGKRRVRVPTID